MNPNTFNNTQITDAILTISSTSSPLTTINNTHATLMQNKYAPSPVLTDNITDRMSNPTSNIANIHDFMMFSLSK